MANCMDLFPFCNKACAQTKNLQSIDLDGHEKII